MVMLLGAPGAASDPLQSLKAFFGIAFAAVPIEQYFLALIDPSALEGQVTAAKTERQWVLVGHYADQWMLCKAMENTVFDIPQVQAGLGCVHCLLL